MRTALPVIALIVLLLWSLTLVLFLYFDRWRH
jgi:hypothetical protein